MDKKIEGLWDCPYCGQKGIGGLTKHCPGCGHPQDADTQFYLPSKKTYLDEEKAAQYGKGADWTCSYCGSINRYNMTSCSNCGASREENDGDYFDNKKKREEEQAAALRKQQEAQRAAAQAAGKAQGKKRLFIILAVLAAIIAVLAIVLSPKKVDSKVLEKSWSREIQVEKFTTVDESDWSVPDGGRVKEEKREIHHYDQVIDHYENVQVQRSRRVQDGYDYSTDYIDNGDGTFTEKTIKNPKYKTEYYYETVQEPVYRDDPVYYTKYYYEIDKWIFERAVDTQGTDDEPYWGDVALAENEREGNRWDEYTVVFLNDKDKQYTAEVPEDLWMSLKKGDGVNLVIQAGKVRKVNDTEIK